MHICVSELTIIGSDNGLSPGRCQAIIWNNAGLLLIEPLGTNFSEISIGIQTFSFKKMHLNVSSAKWRPFCLGLNVLSSHSQHHTKVHLWRCIWTRPEAQLSREPRAPQAIIGTIDFWRFVLKGPIWSQIMIARYRKISNIRHTKSSNLNFSRLGLQLSLRNILKPGVDWRMKM